MMCNSPQEIVDQLRDRMISDQYGMHFMACQQKSIIMYQIPSMLQGRKPHHVQRNKAQVAHNDKPTTHDYSLVIVEPILEEDDTDLLVTTPYARAR